MEFMLVRIFLGQSFSWTKIPVINLRLQLKMRFSVIIERYVMC